MTCYFFVTCLPYVCSNTSVMKGKNLVLLHVCIGLRMA